MLGALPKLFLRRACVSAQSRPTLRLQGLCPPGSSVHEIPQARLLESVAFSCSRGSSQPRNQIQISHITGGFFTAWATREVQLFLKLTTKPSDGYNHPQVTDEKTEAQKGPETRHHLIRLTSPSSIWCPLGWLGKGSGGSRKHAYKGD